MKSSLPKLLVVDDSVDIRESLSLYLERQDMKVTGCESAAAARDALKEASYDLILLDIMMPGEDGLSFCKSLAPDNKVPIIMLTAMHSDGNKIRGLELGADDYVTKPFNPRELLARIRAVLRRSGMLRPAPSQQPRRFSGMIHDAQAQTLLTRAGEVVALTTGENRLLDALLETPGNVLSRTEIARMISRGDTLSSDRAADNCISRLRRKLGDNARMPKLILTEWGGGYRLISTVTQVS